MTTRLSDPAIAAYAALVLALAALWVMRASSSSRRALAWVVPFVLSIVAAHRSGLIDVRGLLALVLFAITCRAARDTTGRLARVTAHAAMLLGAALLFVHLVPGFENPRVLHDVLLGPGSEPYTKHLNFDKGAAGLLLLGLYAPDLPARDDGIRHGRAFLWRFAVVTVTAMMLAVALGYVRLDLKLPSWWPLWAWSMVFLTALPEEALFRGVAQTWIERQLPVSPHRPTVAAAIGGALFGAAHLAGGMPYVVLATVAGTGYGWIFASTRSIGAAVAAHAGLNMVHLLMFSYPALAAAH